MNVLRPSRVRFVMALLLPVLALLATAAPAAAQSEYYTIAPCELYDSRDLFGIGNKLSAGPTPLTISVAGETCTVSEGVTQTIPAEAESVVVNVTVASPSTAGRVAVAPAGGPLLGSAGFLTDQNRALTFPVKLGTGGDVDIRVGPVGVQYHLVVFIQGYYVPRPVLNLDTDNSGNESPDFEAAFVEDAGPVAITDDVTVIDADDTQLDHVTITLTNRPDGAAEVLTADVGATGIVASYDGTTGVLLLQGPASLADFDSVLETVEYDNTATTPDVSPRVVTFVGNDGADDGQLVTTTISSAVANDQPTITPIDDLGALLEDTASTDIPFTINDVETAAASLLVTATSSDQAIVPDANITFGGSGENRTVKVTPAANANGGPVTITVTVDDGSGAPNATATETFTVTFTAVNDAPAGTNNAVSTTEGGEYTFTATDFGFTDPDDTPANALASVVITSLPAAGTLTISGSPVTVGAEIPVASITAGNLKFTPAAGASGSPYTSFTFQVRDDGGTANGGVNLDPSANTLTINVTSVNSAPAGTDNTVTALEDTQYTFTATDFGFTDPNDTPANALASVVITSLPVAGTLTLSGSGFTAGTEIPVAAITAGDLKFAPAANASGSPYTNFTFQVRDNGGTANGGVDLDASPNTLTVNVTPVNDAPAGTDGAISVSEDAQYTLTAADFGLTDPSDTPANALASVVITSLPGAGSLTLSGSGFAAGTEIPVASLGNLVFTPAANAAGSPYTSFTFQVRDNGGTANGGVDLDASANTLTVNVTARNDAPAGTNNTVTTLEETQYTFTVTDFGFTDPNDTPANALASVVITTLPAAGSLTLSGSAFAAGTEIPAASITAGNLKFAPAANGFGTPYSSFTFQVRDDGGTANGGVDLDASANTLSINVTAVNDAPAGGDSSVVGFEDTQLTFTAANFGFTDPNDSPANTLASVVITSLPAAGSLTLSGSAFAAGTEIPVASITAGDLKFIPAANGSGSPYTSFTFQVRDNGGTANGGIDLDPSANTLTINVTAVNDAPAGTDSAVTTPEDVQYTFTAGDFGFGDPNDSPANALASVVITSLPGAGSLTLSGSTFTAGTEIPLASLTAGNLKFLGAANAFGNPYASFTFQVRDNGGTANGGVNLDPTPNNMVITVTPVPDPPVAGTDTFETFGNTELRIDLATVTTPHVLIDLTGPSGVLNNDSDPIENSGITFTNIVGCADLIAPFTCTTANGGQVTVEADGSFRYLPPQANPAVLTTDSTDSFQYTITNGVGASATGTVSLTRREVIWYVDPEAAVVGDGRSHSPFQSFASLNGVAGAGDLDNADDYILVHDGSFNGSVELEAGQRLIGQGVGLTLPLGSLGNREILPATTQPQITNASGDVIRVTSAVPARIAGLSLSGSVNAIDMAATGSYTGSSTLTIESNTFRGAGAEGIDVNAGATGTLALNIQNNTWNVAGTHAGNAVDVNTTNGALRLDLSNNSNVLSTGASAIVAGAAAPGTLTITGFANNTVHQSTAGNGISINAALFDATPGGAVNRVYGGITRIGASGDGVGATGLSLTNVTGDLAFGDEITVGDLDVFSLGAALTATSTVVSGIPQFRLTVTPPANGGSSTLVATGGAAVDVDSVTADLRLSELTSTGGLKGVSLVRLLPGSPAATFPARFHVPSGINNNITTSNAAATAFRVDQSNATVTYQGTVTATAGTGVSLTSNTGSTIDFSGTLTLTTGASPAFAATGGGTVTSTNATSTLTTTTATALNVANTTIGAGGLKFQRISAGTAASGPANGIVLNNTGNSGGLTVSGTGTAGTGGTIQRAATGISLTSTRDVSLAYMQLNDHTDFGIRGASVVNFSMANTVINGTNGNDAGADEGSVRFTELTGSATIASSNISGAAEDNVAIVNTAGTLNRFTLSNTTIGANSTTTGGDGLFVEAQGSAVINVTVQNSFFTSSRGDLAQFTQGSTGSMDVVIQGTAFSDNHPAIVSGGGGVVVGGTNGSMTFNVSNNTFRDATGTAFAVSCGNAGQSCVGRIENNQVGLAGTANSGSTGGSGIAVVSSGGGTVTALINNNQVRQYNNHGILLQAGQTLGNATSFNVTVTNNTVSNPGSLNTNFNGIHLNNGTVPGENFTSCVDIRSNSIAGGGAGTVAPNNADYRLRQRQSTTVRLPGYGGANNNDAAVVGFVSGLQTSVTTGASSNTVGSGGGGFVGGAACAQP